MTELQGQLEVMVDACEVAATDEALQGNVIPLFQNRSGASMIDMTLMTVVRYERQNLSNSGTRSPNRMAIHHSQSKPIKIPPSSQANTKWLSKVASRAMNPPITPLAQSQKVVPFAYRYF